jgi:prepilin-type N-terminal cleavage/methylation domain-containing protein
MRNSWNTLPRRAFTLIEVLFAVLIVGVLLGLLIVGVRRASSIVKRTADREAIQDVATGAERFTRDFGFPPPLVKEAQPPRAYDTALGVNNLCGAVSIGTQNGVKFIQTYRLDTPADLNYLRDEPSTFNAANPLYDRRWSTASVAVYLAGALAEPHAQNAAIPMDGVAGPGMFTPREDGTFKVPAELLITTGNPSGRAQPIPAYMNLGGNGLKVTNDQSNPAQAAVRVCITDKYGTPIRYYRWEPGPPSTPPELLNDLNIPKIVARDPAGFPMKTPPERDLTTNTQARTARFAIVGAGSNKLFGDESPAFIRAQLGLNAGTPNEECWALAEADNIVIVEGGQ